MPGSLPALNSCLGFQYFFMLLDGFVVFAWVFDGDFSDVLLSKILQLLVLKAERLNLEKWDRKKVQSCSKTCAVGFNWRGC